MEIRFAMAPHPEGAVEFYELVEERSKKYAIITSVRGENGEYVRFRLPNDDAIHDSVIRALLTLDPEATVRTARAVYEGLNDFEQQYKARNGGSK